MAPMLIKLISKGSIKKLIVSFFIGETIILSISHHWFNFWGLPWDEQGLIAIVIGPIVSFLIYVFITSFSNIIVDISSKRWMLFLFPALLISLLVTWRSFSLPTVWHHLEIVPTNVSSLGQIQILEIKDSSGSKVELASVSNHKDWALDAGVLVNQRVDPDPIHIDFIERFI